MYRVIACALACWLPAAGADFVTLNLRVLEGEGTVYAPGSRATRGITVEVVDELGRPIPEVAVSFQLPDSGPSGQFVSGGRTDIVTTRQDGRATVWGMRWNNQTGVVNVRITAAKQGVRAGIVVPQRLDAQAAETSPVAAVGAKSRSKALMIAVIVAGAAGAGLAASALRGGGKTVSASPAQTATIGTPTVTIGPPQ